MPQLSLHTPCEDLTITEEEGGIVALDWGWGRDQQPTRLLLHVRAALDAYFHDAQPLPTDLPLAPRGSSFQLRVWKALRAIPHGATTSYAALARSLGSAPRAVGQANARNPIPILIPCHRVVGVAGLGGYSGGAGTETKRYLLDLERRAA